MTLKAISIKNLLRRKGKAAFVLAGLVIGVSTVVGIISFVEAMTNDINHKLEKYGANILIVPKTENLTLSYGGLSLGGVSFEMEEIQETNRQEAKNAKVWYREFGKPKPLATLARLAVKTRDTLACFATLRRLNK